MISTVVSASDIPLRTIKVFSVLFSCVSGHAAGRDKQTFAGASPTVRSRPTLHDPRQLFLSLCSSHVQQSSIASYYTRSFCTLCCIVPCVVCLFIFYFNPALGLQLSLIKLS